MKKDLDSINVNRRGFLEIAGVGAASVLSGLLKPLSAFAVEDAKLLFAEDKIPAAWKRTLLVRGEPDRYTKRRDELRYIGMPVGGIGAGQLYLGGDGRLWHWDIFNQYIFTDDKSKCHYAHPVDVESPLTQNYSLAIGHKVVSLDRIGFDEVSFRGEYPIGIVDYVDPALPLTVRLDAFSPFIPLNTDDSSLPLTVMQFTLTNRSASPVTATLRGELENAICLYHRNEAGVLRNTIQRKKGLTEIIFSAEPIVSADAESFRSFLDYGTMCWALLGDADATSGDATAPLGEKLLGALARTLTIPARKSRQVTFLLAWHFPNLSIKDSLKDCGRFYATKFSSAEQVIAYGAANFTRLAGQTRLWRDTWYDSSLPYWFLDRTFLNTSILATSTCYRLANGRFYGWEGVGNCKGTCGHVYQYAQAIARLFPDIERDLHERVDFGFAQMPDGAIHFRGEFNAIPAIDAQAGYVLRALREHEVTADSSFLRCKWPKIKLAMQWLIQKDGNGDGLIESNQHNTLDTDWYGKVAWLSGLYLAALAASAQMAEEVGDELFGHECRTIIEEGKKNIVEQLFNGEYFINRVDPKHLDAINSGTGCEIDQVMGQSWAFQVGLPRIFPERETISALKSLWRYNFLRDIRPYRELHKPGRWFAMPGEAGLLMCTFPRSDWDYTRARGNGLDWAAGYFNECMAGFEYQVAGHMIREGLTEEGFSICRAIHDRYHASKRNPWNEIECGDHYARSMASYGVYLAACGFEYHGPKGHIGFSPRLSPDRFKCAFTGAAGWGMYTQLIENRNLHAEIQLKWGQLMLKTIRVSADHATSVSVQYDGKVQETKFSCNGREVLIELEKPTMVFCGHKVSICVR